MDGSSRVMVIDDNFYDRSMLTSALHAANFKNVVHAVNGVDAINQIESGLRPDYLFLDIHMPVMDGYEVLSWLQQMRLDTAFKIVIYSDNYRAGGKFPMIKKGLRSELIKRVRRLFVDGVISFDNYA